MALGRGYYVRRGRVYRSRSRSRTISKRRVSRSVSRVSRRISRPSRYYFRTSRTSRRSVVKRSIVKSTSRRRGYHPSYVKYRSSIERAKKMRGFSKTYKVTKSISKPAKPVKSLPKISVKIPKLPKPPDVGKKAENLAKERDKAWDKIISGKDRSLKTIGKAVGLSLLPLDLAKVVTGRAKKPEDYVSAAVDLIFLPLAPLRGVGVGARAAGAALKNLVKSGAKAAGRVAVRTAVRAAGKEVVETGVKAGVKSGVKTGGRMVPAYFRLVGRRVIPSVSRRIIPRVGRRAILRVSRRLIRPTIKPIGRIKPVIPKAARRVIPKVSRRIVPVTVRRALPRAARATTKVTRRLATKRAIRYGAVGLGAFGLGAMLGTRPSPKPSKPAKPESTYPEFMQPIIEPIQPVIQPVDEMAASMMQPLEQIPVFGDIAREARKRKMSWLLLGGLAIGGYLAYKKKVHKKLVKAVT